MHEPIKNSIEIPKVVKPKNRKNFITLGTSVKNSPMSPPSLRITHPYCTLRTERDALTFTTGRNKTIIRMTTSIKKRSSETLGRTLKINTCRVSELNNENINVQGHSREIIFLKT